MASSLILTLLSNHWELVVIAALTIVVAKLYFRLQRPTSSSSSSDNGTEGEFGDPSPQDVDNVGWEEDTDMVPYRPPRYDPEVMQQRARDFYENMNQRRTCRHFSRQAVDIKVLEEVIRTAGTAPSGAHTEPWTYVVVSDPEVKKELRSIVEDEEETNYQRRMGDKWVKDLSRLRTNHVKEYLEVAPYIVLVFKQLYGFNEDGSKKTHYYNEISISISAGLFLAALQNVGLSTVTSTPMNAGPQIRQLVNRPVNEKLILLLPIGYPADDAVVPNLHRKPLEDIIVRV